ncbi:MAG: transglycosylase domain-containing protein [Chloroflexi bacterium]|nr:transglycosylase domain-containing protein [Chloroflexota bacterium]
MADRPPKNNIIPDEPEFTGGWRKPQLPGTWRPVRRREEPAWRRTATVKNLQTAPTTQGGWHLPRPEDALGVAEAEAPAPPAPTEERPDELALIEAAQSGAVPATPAEAAKPAPPPEDFDLSDSQSLLQLEQASAGEAATPALEPAEEDEDAFSMSELMALASLVEQPPKATIVPGVSPAPSLSDTGARPATEPITPVTEEQALDPAEYARRQLEQLSAEPGVQPAATGAQPAAAAAEAEEDPAAYARQRLQELGITGAAVTGAQPAPAAAPLTPEEQDLSRRFRETQEQVRVLRQQYQNGQITRDQLQAQLRQLMILDNNRNWWMMGLETDTWYRFENGQWVVATPPVPLSDTGVMPRAEGYSPAVGMTEFTPGQEVSPAPGVSMDYTQPSAAFRSPADEFSVDESPLPRAVPIQDPDRTVVGTAGAYLDPVRDFEAETIPAAGIGQETVPNPRVSVYSSIPAPAPAGAEPLYDVEAAAPTAEEVVARARQRTAMNILRFALVGVAAVLLLFACGIGFILVQYSNIANQYQAQIAALANYQPEFQTVRVLDVNGDLITTLTSQQGGARTDVPLERISPFMIHAVVSQENERFFEDPGWDWVAIFRAFLQNLGSGQVESGASTITQQIARQLVLHDSTVSPQRKLEEIVIASQIAQQYSKNDILELYLNEIYFGNQNYGVEAASQFYFDHSANDLNLPEAALLTAMIAAPATYDPVRHGGEDLATYSVRREATLDRMDSVIAKMVEVGCLQFQHAPYLNEPFCITPAVVQQAAAQKAAVEARNYRPRDVSFKYPHFVQFVQQMVERNYGPGEMYRRGFVIRTTLNPAIQNVAETALENRLAQIVNTGVNTGSVMVTDPRNGAIRAMVGSPDFNDEQIDGQVNGALTWQQPGSAIKPVVYLGALEGIVDPNTGQARYMTPATILWDVPTTFNTTPPYAPVNFDGQFRGPVPLRYALQGSVNVPTVKVFDFIGVAKFQDVAGRLGLRFPENAQFGLATALGAVEVTLYDMMIAYGTLANDGQRVPLYAIESITDSNGTPVPLPDRPTPVQAVQPSVAFLMQNILSDDTARAGSTFGEGGPLTVQGLPRTNYVAAKTGTTNQNRDLWTVGFTSNAVVGVWLGRPDDAPTFVQGGGYAVVAPLWNEVMQATLRTMPAPQPFTNPGGVVEVQICPLTGTLPTPNCPSLRNELFLANQPPLPAEQSFVRQVAIDTWTGLQANQYCPDNQVVGTYINIDDPTAVAWLNTPAGQAYLRQLGVTGGTIETVPPAACDLNTEIPIARITSPAEGQQVSGVVQVTGSASASTLNRYQLEVATTGTNNFTIVSGPTTTPQTSGVLGTWDTTRFPNGTYTLRLAMFANNGGFLYRTVTVNVVNVPPTPTPTPFVPVQPTQPPVVIPPTIPFEQITPLPFEPVSPP